MKKESVIIWEGVCNLKRHWNQERVGFWCGWGSMDMNAVCCAAAVCLLLVTPPLFAFGTFLLSRPGHMDLLG